MTAGGRAWLAAAALPAAALVLYGGTLRFPPVFDDLGLLGAAAGAELLERRGLSLSSFQWIAAAFGASLPPQRLTNVLLHGATGVMLFFLLARLFAVVLKEERRWHWTAFLGALIFVLHPVPVYGVAYLAQRSIIMATLFSVSSLWCLLEGLLRRSTVWHVAAAVAFALAVMSKEHAVMLPAVAAALTLLVRGASLAALRRAGPALLILGVISLATAYQFRALLGGAIEPFAAEVGGERAPSLALSMLNQGHLYFRYLATWLAPCPCWMSVDLRVELPSQLLAWPQTLGALAFVAYPVAAMALVRKGGRLGLAGLGLLYPWLLFLVELATVRLQEPFVLYRSYLWMSGLPLVLPALTHRLSPRVRHAVLAAACAVLVPLTAERIGTFSSPLRLWDDAVRKSEGSTAPYRERALVNRGELLRGAGRTQAALADYNAALAINPRLAGAYVGRATLLLEQGRAREALDDLDRGLALDGNSASALAKRCFAKATLSLGEAEVLADCERARALDPRDPEVAAVAERVRRRLAGPRGGG